MAKIKYTHEPKIRKSGLDKIKSINAILTEYVLAGYSLTLRQLYYQLVSRALIQSSKQSYERLCNLTVKGRMQGMIDWNSIVDRNRVPQIPAWYKNENDAIDQLQRSYRIDRMSGQDVYIEVWVEKDALSEIIFNRSSHYHVRMMVNRGYSSASAIWRASERFKRASTKGLKTHILYFGDHDPSGLDMVRDISERMESFGVPGVEVSHLGITMSQIKELNPPPFWAKVKDPRSKWYIKEFGDESWEVDALEPQMIESLITTNIEALIDMKKFKNQVDLEKQQRDSLLELPKVKGRAEQELEQVNREIESLIGSNVLERLAEDDAPFEGSFFGDDDESEQELINLFERQTNLQSIINNK